MVYEVITSRVSAGSCRPIAFSIDGSLFIFDGSAHRAYEIVRLEFDSQSQLKTSFYKYNLEMFSYKKNLKALYLVHPTTFIRMIWRLFKPFISIKFERKVHYVNYLYELDAHVRIDQLGLAQVVKELRQCLNCPIHIRIYFLVMMRRLRQRWILQIKLNQQHRYQLSSSTFRSPSKSRLYMREKLWRFDSQPRLKHFFSPINLMITFSILKHNPDCEIPAIVTDLIGYLRANALDVEGIFRRSADLAQIRRLQDRINKGISLANRSYKLY